MRSVLLVVLLLASACNPPPVCTDDPELLDGEGTFTCSLPDWPGRDYILHLPRGYDGTTPRPLVFAIHGFTQTKEHLVRTTCPNGDEEDPGCLLAVADAQGFIVVLPDGDGLLQAWNSQGDANRPDDLKYFDELLGALRGVLAVDGQRIHATGFSNGGGMAHRLACERSGTYASIVSVGSGRQLTKKCEPDRPVAVMEMHGTEDPIWPDEGREMVPSVEATMEGTEDAPGWARINGCSLERTSESLPDQDGDGQVVTRFSYPGCTGHAEVVFLEVEGGGHTWPGGWQYAAEGLIGATTGDINANRVLWDFLRAHPLR